MPKFHTIVTVECETREEAITVISERIGYDEEYGFTYRIEHGKVYEEEVYG